MPDTVEEIRKMDEDYKKRTRNLGKADADPGGKEKADGAKTVWTEKAKTCSTCKEIKPLSEFYKKAKNKDGLRYSCKKCVRQKVKDYNEKRKKTDGAQKKSAAPDKKQNQAPAQKPQAGPAKDTSRDKLTPRLTLDFSDHPELYHRLVEAAEADIRPLEMEVLYLVKKVFERADRENKTYQAVSARDVWAD